MSFRAWFLPRRVSQSAFQTAVPVAPITKLPHSAHRRSRSRLWRRRSAWLGVSIIALFYLTALAAPLLAPHDPLKQNYSNVLQAGVWATGDWRFPLGTDQLGRDVASRLLYGARVSMTVSLIPVFLMLVIGGSIGMLAGIRGERTDTLLMRLTDVMFAFPTLLWLIVVTAALRDTRLGAQWDGMLLILGALAVTGWQTIARLVRGLVRQEREQEYIAAARLMGAGTARILYKHILPNISSPILVAAVLAIPAMVVAEAALAFIGLGIRPPAPSWGAMIVQGQSVLVVQPAVSLAPCLALTVLALGFLLLGEALQERGG